VIAVFIEELDLAGLGFAGMTPVATGGPAYHPSTLLKIYLYGEKLRQPLLRQHTGRLGEERGTICVSDLIPPTGFLCSPAARQISGVVIGRAPRARGRANSAGLGLSATAKSRWLEDQKMPSVPAREHWEEFPPTLVVDETWRIPVRTPTHTA
jgi:hypothetical protein